MGPKRPANGGAQNKKKHPKHSDGLGHMSYVGGDVGYGVWCGRGRPLRIDEAR